MNKHEQLRILDTISWDRDTFFRRCRHKNERILLLISMFTEDMPGYIATASDAFLKGDWQTLKKTAHIIRGVSGNLGGQKLYCAASVLEAEAARGREHECRMALGRVQENCILLMDELNTYVKQAGE